MKKVDRRIKRTRQLLSDALISLIDEKEFSSISITDIVNKSDLNRSTFYAHFRDKEELLTWIINDLIDGMIKSMQESINLNQSNINQRGTASVATIQLFTYVANQSAYFKILLYPERVPQFMFQLSDSLYSFYSKEIECLHKSDILLINKGFLANYLSSVLGGVIYHWLVSTDMKYTPDYIAEEFTKILTLKPYIPYIHSINN